MCKDALVWMVVLLRRKVPYHQRFVNTWNIAVYVSPEMFSFPCVLTDALHCWMVTVFTHPIMPIGPEGGGFTASSLPPPHSNLPWFSEDPVSLSLRYFFLSLTWAKHAPVFLKPLWNCHVLRHLCCGCNYTLRTGSYFTTYKKYQQFVWTTQAPGTFNEEILVCIHAPKLILHNFLLW